MDGMFPIQADTSGAALKAAVPCVGGPSVEGGSQTAIQSAKADSLWNVAEAASVASALGCVGAMAAAEARDLSPGAKLKISGSAHCEYHQAKVREQTFAGEGGLGMSASFGKVW